VLLKVDSEEFEEEDRSYMLERFLDELREEKVRQKVKDILEKARALVYS
jgi:hypothetical protein